MSNRGSEWHKWDLHIHTPKSIINDYGGDTGTIWDNFITELEKLPKDISVIGITDYYFIDGYEKVMEYKNKGRLSNIIKIFPVLEFRIDTFGSGNENNLQKINLHILFNLDERILADEIKKVKEQFISQIPISSLDEHETIKLSRENLIEYGTTLQKGFDGFIPPTKNVFKCLSSPQWKNKTFLMLGYKEWSNLEKNQQLKPLKEDLYNKVNVFLSSNYSDDSQKWLDDYGKKKLLHSNDIHDFNKLDKKNYYCNTWIKADLTFEGLKQIIYEPESRVKIQQDKPEEKKVYQVIDSVRLNEDGFWKNTIYLNQNLNVIIGGRGTGKSTLLSAIAKKIDNNIKLEREEYQDKDRFIQDHSGNITIEWKDKEKIDVNRDIDFFYQGQMHDITKDEKEKNKLIDKIINEKEIGKNIEEYKKNNNEIKKKISKDILELFQAQEELENLQNKLKEEGDCKVVEKEIERLNFEIKKLSFFDEVSEKEQKKYQEQGDKKISLEQNNKSLINDLSLISLLKKKKIVDDNYIEYEQFYELSNDTRNEIKNIFDRFKKDVDKEWRLLLKGKEEEFNNKIKNNEKEIQEITKNEVFIKCFNYYKNNKELNEFQKKLSREKERLVKIKKLRENLARREKIKEEKILKIVKNHELYKIGLDNLVKSLNIKEDDVEIHAKVYCKVKDIREFFESKLNRRGDTRQNYIDDFVSNYEKDIQIKCRMFLKDAIENNLLYKNYNKKQDVINEFFVNNWFYYSFDLIYQGDSFSKMSPGKQAFVILKLLLEFSERECPILIDQPEDSLDNRAIYNELVEYIRKKKLERQIIVVSHNSNVVVGADAENIIVANHHGDDSKNKNGVKFQYINGSLESTKKKDRNEFILESQGIREHVCEILEGGKEAFRKREQKYGLD